MEKESVEASKVSAIAQWQSMRRDVAALLAMPGAHHKALVSQAHSLHQQGFIDAGTLNDLLELADAALAYAFETLLDDTAIE